MNWAGSLTRIAGYEVETLQKRLAEVAGRRLDAELRRTLLDAEAEAEADNARSDPEAAIYYPQFIKGWRVRRDRLDTLIKAIAVEEEGARDALSRAFEDQKKYEQVVAMADAARSAGAIDAAERVADLVLRVAHVVPARA